MCDINKRVLKTIQEEPAHIFKNLKIEKKEKEEIQGQVKISDVIQENTKNFTKRENIWNKNIF